MNEQDIVFYCKRFEYTKKKASSLGLMLKPIVPKQGFYNCYFTLKNRSTDKIIYTHSNLSSIYCYLQGYEHKIKG